MLFRSAECIRMKLGKPDAKGRRSPLPIEGSNFILECDTAVLALGYSVEEEIAETTPELKVTKWGTLLVKSQETGETSREEIYAAGDNVRGADLVVTAVAAARKAARAMHGALLNLKARRKHNLDQLWNVACSGKSLQSKRRELCSANPLP